MEIAGQEETPTYAGFGFISVEHPAPSVHDNSALALEPQAICVKMYPLNNSKQSVSQCTPCNHMQPVKWKHDHRLYIIDNRTDSSCRCAEIRQKLPINHSNSRLLVDLPCAQGTHRSGSPAGRHGSRGTQHPSSEGSPQAQTQSERNVNTCPEIRSDQNGGSKRVKCVETCSQTVANRASKCVKTRVKV